MKISQFEISVYWNEYKEKMRMIIRQMSIDIFLNQNLLELMDCSFLFIQMKNNHAKKV